MAAEHFDPRDDEQNTRDSRPSDEAPDWQRARDERQSDIADACTTDRCWTCKQERTTEEVVACEQAGPGRVGCLFGGERGERR